MRFQKVMATGEWQSDPQGNKIRHLTTKFVNIHPVPFRKWAWNTKKFEIDGKPYTVRNRGPLQISTGTDSVIQRDEKK